MAVLGIDIGTSSVKALILDEHGHTLATGRRDHPLRVPQTTWAEGDPEDWWHATSVAVQSALADASGVRISAIGLSGQMHGVVLTDRQGQPRRPALLWPDTRAREELAAYRALPAEALQRLANPLVPGMCGPLLLWLARHEPAIYRSAHWALQPKGWLYCRLTGQVTADHSDASATLLYDVPARCWADDIIDSLGLVRRLFPVLASSDDTPGELSTGAAAVLGLAAGLPIAIGAADTAAAALGSGLLSPGPVQLTMGTGAQLIQLCAQPHPDPTLRTHLYVAADGTHWYRMAAVQNAGLAIDWVRRLLRVDWPDVYGSVTTGEPGARGVTFLPQMTQERPHHPVARTTGAFLGLRIDHQIEDLLRAALEGVAFGIRVALEAIPGMNTSDPIRVTGGGNLAPGWRQLLADVLGRELLPVEVSDASARGAALLGGIATGIWADASATSACAPATQTCVVPHTSRAAAYNELYQHYLSASSQTP